MATTSNGLTHLIFGQNYPASYSPRQDGEYTDQVRTFQIIDNASGLSFLTQCRSHSRPKYTSPERIDHRAHHPKSQRPAESTRSTGSGRRLHSPSWHRSGPYRSPSIRMTRLPEPDPTAVSTFATGQNSRTAWPPSKAFYSTNQTPCTRCSWAASAMTTLIPSPRALKPTPISPTSMRPPISSPTPTAI